MIIEVMGVKLSPIGGIIGLVFGSVWDNAISPEFHGTGQPHDPNTGDMITEGWGYIRWLIGKVGGQFFGSFAGALIAPKVAPALLSNIQNGISLKVFLFTFTVIWISYTIYESNMDNE